MSVSDPQNPHAEAIHAAKEPQPGPVRGTAENDAAARSAFPQLGDTVRVSVDFVPYEDRKLHHHRVEQQSANGRIGTVIGTEVVGGVLMLRIESDASNVLVPADCCRLNEPPPQPKAMQEPRQSPEKMRKPSTGAYKMT